MPLADSSDMKFGCLHNATHPSLNLTTENTQLNELVKAGAK